MNLIEKIRTNKSVIVGIRIDGTFYDIGYIDIDVADNNVIIYAYQLDEHDSYIEYVFNVNELTSNNVKLYKLQEV